MLGRKDTTKVSELPELPFPKCGVKLAVFIDLVAKYSGQEYDCGENEEVCCCSNRMKPFEEMTTTEVCNFIVKPLVEEKQLSYCDYLLQTEQSSLVGEKASVFVSHAWKFKFAEVVDSLSNHFQDEPNTIIWFDLFSNNQIKAPNLSFAWWSTTFMSAIESFGRVVAICSPWDDPIPFKRAWCLWEYYCAQVTKSKFEVAMSEKERGKLIQTLVSSPLQILQILANIDVKNSESWKKTDRDAIFEMVEKLPNKFDTINSLIKACIRAWVIGRLSTPFSKSESKMDEYTRLYTLSRVYQELNCDEDGKATLNQCLSILKDLGMERSLEYAKCLNTLGWMDVSMSSDYDALDRGCVLLFEALKTRRERLGSNHIDVAESMNKLGCGLKNMNRLDTALELFEGALKIRVNSLGESDTSVGNTLNNIADVYKLQQNYDLCLQTLERVLQIYGYKYGDNHWDYGYTLNRKCDILILQEKYGEALECDLKYSQIATTSLGWDYRFNFMITGDLYEKMEDFGKAMECYKGALEYRIEQFGSENWSVGSAMITIGNLYSVLNDRAQCLSFSQKGIKILKAAGEENHPQYEKGLKNIEASKLSTSVKNKARAMLGK